MAKAIAVPNIAKPESCLYGLMTTQHPRQSPGSAASLVLLLVPIPPGVIRLYWAAQAATLTNGCTADDRDEYPLLGAGNSPACGTSSLRKIFPDSPQNYLTSMTSFIAC
jgi:hypothetical protein